MINVAKKAELFDDIVDIVRVYLEPGDVFEESVLEDWAKKNGYKKEE